MAWRRGTGSGGDPTPDEPPPAGSPFGDDILSSDGSRSSWRVPDTDWSSQAWAAPVDAPAEPSVPDAPPEPSDVEPVESPEESPRPGWREAASWARGEPWRDGLRWLRSRRAALIIAIAFVLGSTIGGAAIHQWDAQRADAKSRDTVRLAARVAADDVQPQFGGRRPWILRVVLANNGESDLVLNTGRLVDNRFQSWLRSVSHDIKIRAGSETWISLSVANSCTSAGPGPSPRALELTVTPPGRPSRTVQVRLADDSARLVDAARESCVSPQDNVWAFAAVGPTTTVGRTLTMPMRIDFSGVRALEVRSVGTTTGGLSVAAAGLPARFTETQTEPITMRWTIVDCDQAGEPAYSQIDLNATIALLDSTQTIKVTVNLAGDAVLAVARFVTRTCD